MRQALRRYYRGATLSAMEEVQTGERRNYFFDHQGTVQCLTDATGAVTDRFASDAWGVTVKRTGTSINRQWYVGNLGYYRQVDQALDYVRARYYGPEIAAWLSVDPVYRTDLYRYAEGRVSLNVDPSGWQAVRPAPGPRVGKCRPEEQFIEAGEEVLVAIGAAAGAVAERCCRVVRGPWCAPLVLLALAVLCRPRDRKEEKECKDVPSLKDLPEACPLAGADSLSNLVAGFNLRYRATCPGGIYTYVGGFKKANPCGNNKGKHVDVCCGTRAPKPGERPWPPGKKDGYDCPREFRDVGTIYCCPWCEKLPGQAPRQAECCCIHRDGNTVNPGCR